jgi:molybdopterin molybdotransferase
MTMITYEEALAHVTRHALPRSHEAVPLEEAAGRVLAAPVHAARNAPHADISAMDGYGVLTENIEIGQSLLVVGAAYPARALPVRSARANVSGSLPERPCHRAHGA